MISKKFKINHVWFESLGCWRNIQSDSIECHEDGCNFYIWTHYNQQTYAWLKFSTYQEVLDYINLF